MSSSIDAGFTTATLTGDVVRVGDSGYKAARVGWNRLYPCYPETIVFCRNTQDVVHAVEWARQKRIALRARSGRHSLEGWSSIDGGLVIDVSRMKSIEIDEAARTATVGTGLSQAESVPALGQRGFVVPTGSEGGVGLGGVIPGGGSDCSPATLAWLATTWFAPRSWWPTARARRGLSRREADEHLNSDLLWAWRGGGGGNFGTATSYTLKLHELSDVQFLIAKWTGHGALGHLLRTWQRDAPIADERLTSA